MQFQSTDVYVKNATYQRWEVLKTNRNKRYRHAAFLVEGVRNINEAVRGGWEIESFLFADGAALSGWAQDLLSGDIAQENYRLHGTLLAELSGKTDPSELLAVVRMRLDDALPDVSCENPLIVLFDRPSNKGNLGTVLRTCDAFGADLLLVAGHAVDPYDPETVAASMGSLFAQPFVRISDMEALEGWISRQRERFPSWTIVGTSAHAETALYDCDLTGPVMLLIGNETDGLSSRLSQMSTVIASIPMDAGSSATSLNVACAATVLLYEAARQRG